jgi:hypothetical protein
MLTEEPKNDKEKLQLFWVDQIAQYDRDAEPWVSRAKKIQKRYKDERGGNNASDSATTRYNILWSNIQTLKPALYAKDPTPEVERRFKDKDDAGRVASEVLERCLSYSISTSCFGSIMRQGVLDKLLCGRGTGWVRYVPHMRDVDLVGSEEIQDEGFSITDDVDEDEQQTEQEIEYEEILYDFVYFEEFGHTKARTWEEVRAVWRMAYLDRDELVERFGEEIGATIPLDHKEDSKSESNAGKKATIYEIWDKKTEKAIWLSKEVKEILDERDDPLELEGFFPCPKPMFATLANDSTIPVPDYYLYQDQAISLDQLSQRIALITDAVKVAGVYDASAPGIGKLLLSGSENTLIPVDSWAVFSEKGGMQGAISMLPVLEIANVLNALYDIREKVKADLYEISGMSDIIRGASDPAETATAQQIKSNYASVRLDEMQRDVQRFACDLLKIGGQIIASQFQLETIKMISGIKLMTEQEKAVIQQQQAMQQGQLDQNGQPIQPPPLPKEQAELMAEPTWEEVDALLKDNASRCFRIDVETDSTISQDAQQEQQSRLEFVQTIGQVLQGANAIAQTTPALLPAVKESVMFLLRSYKVGRTTEASFQTAMDKLGELSEQPPQGDGKGQKQDNSVQVETIKQQGTAQNDAQKADAAMQLEALRHANDLQFEAMKQQHQSEMERLKIQHSAELERAKEWQADKTAQAKIASAHSLQTSEMIHHAAENEADRQAQALQASANFGGVE